MLADVVLLGNAALPHVHRRVDKDFQRIGMIRKDVETATANDDARLLVGNPADSVSLRPKQRMTRLFLLLSVVLRLGHIRPVEVGEVVAPQRVARLNLLHSVLNGFHP